MRTYEIHEDHGHLLINLDGRRALIDTGSPMSMAEGAFEFLGAREAPPADIMGIGPRKMSELAGFQIDILIGCDLLARQNLRIRWRDQAIDFGDDIPDGPIAAELTALMGIPVFPLTLQNRATRALFDTGAHLSYIDPELVRGQAESGRREDFFPTVGRFVAPTYRVATALDDAPLDIEYGILPDSLRMMLGLAMAMSGSSAVVGTQILKTFDCAIAWDRNVISWRRREAAAGEPRG